MRNLVERAAAITVLATALVACTGGPARGGLVTYTETATISGSLGSTTFTDATITLTQTADTASGVKISPVTGELYILDATSSLVLSGGGLASPLSASFTFASYTLTSPTSGHAGVGERIGPPALGFIAPVLAVTNDVFSTYDLTSSLGPVSGASFIQSDSVPFGTTAGELIINEAGIGTFQAVPEPSSLAMSGIAALVGFGLARHRRGHS